jgi:hypothetical protein
VPPELRKGAPRRRAGLPFELDVAEWLAGQWAGFHAIDGWRRRGS